MKSDHNGRDYNMVAVSSELPWPLNAGGRIRTFHLLKGAARHFRVHLVSSSASPRPDAVRALAEHGIHANVLRVAPKRRTREMARALRCRADGIPYVLYGRHKHRGVRAAIEALCKQLLPAVLYLDHLDSFAYRDVCPRAVSVLDMHNVYSLLVERSADERAWPMRRYLRGEARLLRSIESVAASECDLLFAVSPQELSYYRALGGQRAHLVPNGVDALAYADLPVGRPDSSLMVFVGSMSWRPNVEAATFLAREVLPAVRRQHKDVRLRIIGRDPPPELWRLHGSGGVEVTGEVESVIPHLRDAAFLAVPLEAGGGTRLKILEALAAGVPVISTAIGAEGLDLIPEVHFRLATRQDFAQAVTALLADPDKARNLVARGREAVREQYDWRQIGSAAADHLRSAAKLNTT